MLRIDYQPLLNLLGDFWKDHENLPQIKTFWEGLIRSIDDDWLQLRQAQASRYLSTLPTYIRHSFLYRKIDNWADTGVFHRHRKKTWRASALQSVFYVGAFVEPGACRVFVEGKELDAQGGDFRVTYDQDLTQPGTNPRGSRLILRNGVPGSSSVQLIAMRETFWYDEIISTPINGVGLANPINPLSVQVYIDSLEITQEIQINGAGTVLSFKSSGATSSLTQDDRRFLRGERIRVVDVGGTQQTILVSATSTQLTIPTAVNPAAQVFRVISLDVSDGKVVLETGAVSVPGQLFAPNTRLRVSDEAGMQTVNITEATDTVVLERPVNPESAHVYYLGADIWRGIEASATGVSFERSFQVGVRLWVRGAYHMLHDHASYHVELTAASDRAGVPPTRPWVLTAGGVEKPEYPIELCVDGMLQHPDQYIFMPGAETYMVRFMNGGTPNWLPAGTKIDFFYVDNEDDRLHKHIYDRYESVTAQIAFKLSEPHDARYPLHLTLDGITQNDPDNYGYNLPRDFLGLSEGLAPGTIVKINGIRLEFPYQAEVDTDIVESDFEEVDQPVSRIVGAGFLQDGIEPGVDQLLTKLPVHLSGEVPEEGFSISLLRETVSGFIVKASAIVEDAWFADALVDERTAWLNFGAAIGLERETTDLYVRTIQALFSGYFRGSQPYTLENFACIIMGSSYLDEPSVTKRIIDDGTSRSVVVTGATQEWTYGLSEDVPDRLRAGVMPRLHALIGYCQVLPLTEENCPWFPAVAETFGVDWSFAHRFDIRSNATIAGVSPAYDALSGILVDTTKRFVDGDEGEVWMGDLVRVEWSGGSRAYGRITEVIDNTSLRVSLTVPAVTVGYGDAAYGGTAVSTIHGYGGLAQTETIVSYSIAARKTERLDTHRFLDALDPEDFGYVNSVLIPLFQPFVFLVRLSWAGLKGGFLDDVQHFLDTAKPAYERYIAFAQVNEDEGLSDSFDLGLRDDPVDVEFLANEMALDLGSLDAGGLIGSSIGVA